MMGWIRVIVAAIITVVFMAIPSSAVTVWGPIGGEFTAPPGHSELLGCQPFFNCLSIPGGSFVTGFTLTSTVKTDGIEVLAYLKCDTAQGIGTALWVGEHFKGTFSVTVQFILPIQIWPYGGDPHCYVNYGMANSTGATQVSVYEMQATLYLQ